MNQPLYQKIAESIFANIQSGALKMGQRFPPESDYAEQLGVSRSTVRAAFAQLEQQGIIKRRKRGGTEIIADKPLQRFNIFSTGVHDLISVGRDVELILTDLDFVNSDEVAELKEHKAVCNRWLRVTGNRYLLENLDPFAWTHTYVPDHFADIELEVGQTLRTVFSVVEQKYNVFVGRIRQKVSAVACCEPAAKAIGLETGAPVLNLLTTLESTSGELMVVSCVEIDPARFSIYSDITVDA